MCCEFNYSYLCPYPSFTVGLLNSLVSQQASWHYISIGLSVVVIGKIVARSAKRNDTGVFCSARFCIIVVKYF